MSDCEQVFDLTWENWVDKSVVNIVPVAMFKFLFQGCGVDTGIIVAWLVFLVYFPFLEFFSKSPFNLLLEIVFFFALIPLTLTEVPQLNPQFTGV